MVTYVVNEWDGEVYVPQTVGCYMDGSHWRGDNFSLSLIRFCQNLGWDGGEWDVYLLAKDHSDSGEDVSSELCEALYDASEDSVDWLNAQRKDDLVWTVEEQCLYLTKGNDDE